MPHAFGRYRVLNLIGQGTWGPVFRARDTEHHVAAVIKTFGADWPADDVWRLSEELVSLVASRRPHDVLVTLFGAGVENDVAFLAMQAEAGQTLDAALPSIAPAPVDRTLTLLDAVAQAIDAAWRDGIGHGALNPRDVFVTSEGQLACITGFGVSQAIRRARHAAVPRRVYTAPERSSGGWGIQADVFSLGAIAHELLTGRRPIGPGEQDGELGTDVPARQRAQIRRVLASALAVRPDQRFPSARAFVSALAETAGFRLEPGDARGARDRLPAEAGPPAPAIAPDSMRLPLAATHTSAAEASVAALDLFSHLHAHGGPEPGQSQAADVPAGLLGASSTLGAVTEQPALPTDPVRSRRQAVTPVLVTILVGLALGGGAVFALLRPRTVRLVPPPPMPVVAAPAVDRTPPETAPKPPPPVEEKAAAPEVPRRAPRASRAEPVATIVPIGRSRDRETAAAVPAPAATALGAIFGTIDVDSRPRGARVIIDGRFVGTAPLRLPEMSAGVHTIIVETEGRPAVSRRVQVEAGQVARVRVDLE